MSAEEQRVEAEIKAIATSLKYNLFFWSVADGLVDAAAGNGGNAQDPLDALVAVEGLKENTIILFRDFHLFLQEPNPILLRKLKDVLSLAKTKSKTIIVLGCRLCLPPELEREFTVVEFALPGKEQLGVVLDAMPFRNSWRLASAMQGFAVSRN